VNAETERRGHTRLFRVLSATAIVGGGLLQLL
jgi:hypothetical protein